MSASQSQPSEEQLRAAYEEQLRQVRVEHVLLDNVVTMVNLGMRRTGLVPGTESERDPAQVRLAIESVRALMPMLEAAVPDQARPLREALSQLQLAFVQIGGSEPAAEGAGSPAPGAAASGAGPAASGGTPGPASPGAAPGTGGPEPAGQQPPAVKPGEPGPAQRSGRLWVPGQ